MTEDPSPAKETVYSPFRTGATFRGLEILGNLGKGGMGVVYKARQTSLDRTVALKVLAPQYADSPQFLHRFEREARILASVNHPNVTQIHEFGKEGDFIFLLLEYVEGQDLDSILSRGKAINPARFLHVIREVAKALEAVHAAGLVHRDIKPANILLTKKGVTKLTDFGLAVDTEDKGKLTENGFFIGTPHYVSPEHVQGKRVDGRSDLYSLGVIIYQGFAGRPPFQAASNTALLMKHVQEPPPPLYKYAPNAPKEVGEIVRKLLAKNPASRHDSAGALLRDLDRAIEAAKLQPGTQRKDADGLRILQSGEATPRGKRTARATPKKMLPSKLVGGAAAAVALVILALFFFFGGSSGESPRTEPTAQTAKQPPAPPPSKERTPAPLPEPELPSVPKPAPRTPEPPKAGNQSAKLLEQALAEGDALLSEARRMYDEGTAAKSAETLTKAAFRAEEAKLKYQAVIELGDGAAQEKAIAQIRALQQLIKMAGESRLAISRPAVSVPSTPPSKETPPPPTPVVTPAPAPKRQPPAEPAPDAPEPLPEDTRTAVPDGRALRDAQADVRKTFDVAAARSPDERAALARSILETAGTSETIGPELYAMLLEARDLAAAGEDAATALEAADRLGSSFKVDGLLEKVSLLTKTRVRGAAGPWASACLDVAEEAKEVGDYARAVRLADRAKSLARSARDQKLYAFASGRSREFSSLERAASRLKPHLATLESRPDDPRANAEVGTFLCLVRGDWAKGLPMLAKGSDAALRDLAKKDLAAPSDPAEQAALGEAWSARAKKAPEAHRLRLRSRAAFWLKRAIGGLSGLARVSTEKTLDDLGPEATGTLTVDLGANLRIEFAYIEPGVFTMGGTEPNLPQPNEWQADERPTHPVRITKGFFMGTTEVTRGQFAAFVRATNYKTDAERAGFARVPNPTPARVEGASWKNPNFPQTDDHPVVCVSWNDAQAYCRWLAGKIRREVRLPTEAEWEYACRAGTETKWYFGDTPGAIQDHGWIRTNSGGQTRPVGIRTPNPWGLYDIYGNVWEWCQDWAGPYPKGSVTDPTGAGSGVRRCVRGGGWGWEATECRSAIRSSQDPSAAFGGVGFRIVSP